MTLNRKVFFAVSLLLCVGAGPSRASVVVDDAPTTPRTFQQEIAAFLPLIRAQVDYTAHWRNAARSNDPEIQAWAAENSLCFARGLVENSNVAIVSLYGADTGGSSGFEKIFLQQNKQEWSRSQVQEYSDLANVLNHGVGFFVSETASTVLQKTFEELLAIPTNDLNNAEMMRSTPFQGALKNLVDVLYDVIEYRLFSVSTGVEVILDLISFRRLLSDEKQALLFQEGLFATETPQARHRERDRMLWTFLADINNIRTRCNRTSYSLATHQDFMLLFEKALLPVVNNFSSRLAWQENIDECYTFASIISVLMRHMHSVQSQTFYTRFEQSCVNMEKLLSPGDTEYLNDNLFLNASNDLSAARMIKGVRTRCMNLLEQREAVRGSVDKIFGRHLLSLVSIAHKKGCQYLRAIIEERDVLEIQKLREYNIFTDAEFAGVLRPYVDKFQGAFLNAVQSFKTEQVRAATSAQRKAAEAESFRVAKLKALAKQEKERARKRALKEKSRAQSAVSSTATDDDGVEETLLAPQITVSQIIQAPAVETPVDPAVIEARRMASEMLHQESVDAEAARRQDARLVQTLGRAEATPTPAVVAAAPLIQRRDVHLTGGAAKTWACATNQGVKYPVKNADFMQLLKALDGFIVRGDGKTQIGSGVVAHGVVTISLPNYGTQVAGDRFLATLHLAHNGSDTIDYRALRIFFSAALKRTGFLDTPERIRVTSDLIN